MQKNNVISIGNRYLDLSVLYEKILELEEQVVRWSQSCHTLKVRTLDGIEIIPFNNILRCQSDGNYTNIFLKDGQRICCSKTLKKIQNYLPNDQFLRIHASHLISIREVRKIHYSQRKGIVLSNGEFLPVSRTYNYALASTFSYIV